MKAWSPVAAAGPQGRGHLHLGLHHEDAMDEAIDDFTAEGLLEKWGRMKVTARVPSKDTCHMSVLLSNSASCPS